MNEQGLRGAACHRVDGWAWIIVKSASRSRVWSPIPIATTARSIDVPAKNPQSLPAHSALERQVREH